MKRLHCIEPNVNLFREQGLGVLVLEESTYAGPN